MLSHWGHHHHVETHFYRREEQLQKMHGPKAFFKTCAYPLLKHVQSSFLRTFLRNSELALKVVHWALFQSSQAHFFACTVKRGPVFNFHSVVNNSFLASRVHQKRTCLARCHSYPLGGIMFQNWLPSVEYICQPGSFLSWLHSTSSSTSSGTLFWSDCTLSLRTRLQQAKRKRRLSLVVVSPMYTQQ